MYDAGATVKLSTFEDGNGHGTGEKCLGHRAVGNGYVPVQLCIRVSMATGGRAAELAAALSPVELARSWDL